MTILALLLLAVLAAIGWVAAWGLKGDRTVKEALRDIANNIGGGGGPKEPL